MPGMTHSADRLRQSSGNFHWGLLPNWKEACRRRGPPSISPRCSAPTCGAPGLLSADPDRPLKGGGPLKSGGLPPAPAFKGPGCPDGSPVRLAGGWPNSAGRGAEPSRGRPNRRAGARRARGGRGRGSGSARGRMESLLQQLERFSEVLAVSRTAAVSAWGPAAVRRAVQWARYLRRAHGRLRAALEGRRRAGPRLGAWGGRDVVLSARLLGNRALGAAAHRCLLRLLFPGPAAPAPAAALQARLARLARRRGAVRLLLRGGPAEDAALRTQAELLLRRLRDGPAGGLLDGLWARAPRAAFLRAAAAALLLDPAGPAPGELLRWLLGRADALAALCRDLPAARLAALAARHPALRRAYLRQLARWGCRLRYDLPSGRWEAAEPAHVSWAELRGRFLSLARAPPPLKDAALAALEAWSARDGAFRVRGLSVWTDLLLALGPGAGTDSLGAAPSSGVLGAGGCRLARPGPARSPEHAHFPK
uniref:Fanconi anemia group F protein n=1 Tax=Canis lupus familiaris TaxID=9615 RepID=A0A8C0Q169_CANLF